MITSVGGVAAGAGASTAIAGDIMIFSEKATLIQVFINVGLVPDIGGTYFLTRALGPAKAMKLMLAGEPIGAKEVFELGLVTEVAADGLLQDTTKK